MSDQHGVSPNSARSSATGARQNEDQSKNHSHTHSHASSSRKRLGWALGITAFVFVAEIVGAFFTGSLALLADAGHMAADSMGLVIALIAATMMARPRSDRRTWGFARAEVLAAGLQAGLLIVLCLVIAWQAISRLLSPPVIEAGPMLWVGLFGLVANLISMALLVGGRKESLNLRAAFLEVTADALGSVAVIVAAGITLATGWPYADSVASLLIGVLIGARAYVVLKESVGILMEETPYGLDLAEVRGRLLENPEVIEIHDLHASRIGTGLTILTAHVIITETSVKEGRSVEVLHDLQHVLETGFDVDINHVTLQLDTETHASHENLAH